MEELNLKFGVIGYGRLGKSIAEQATQRGHSVHLLISSANVHELTIENLKSCDVLIECSTPDSVIDNLQLCATSGVPTLCGTTGWTKQYTSICEAFNAHNSAFLYASNFSVGMNITFILNSMLAQLTSKSNYTFRIDEIHHTAKLDKPSGTAITLAEEIISESNYSNWSLETNTDESNLYINSERIPNVVGDHTIHAHSEVDQISIIHKAHSRDGFGLGAVLAAEFLYDKKGIYTMKDVLGFKS